MTGRSRAALLGLIALLSTAALGAPAPSPRTAWAGHQQSYDEYDNKAQIVCPPFGQVPPAPFDDVQDNHHRDWIDCLSWYGVAQGVDAQHFAPTRPVRRDQAAGLLARALDELRMDLPPAGDRFRDVDGNVHEDDIERLAAAGILEGTGPSTFGPAGDVSRGQLASVLWRAYVASGADPWVPGQDRFSDDDGSVHEANTNNASERLLVKGYTAARWDSSVDQRTERGTYGPYDSVRRDQMTSFVTRLMGLALMPHPRGKAVLLRDGWALTLLASDEDAAAEVQAHDPSNPGPARGRYYVMIRFRATYLGEGTSSFDGAERLRADFPDYQGGGSWSHVESPCGSSIPDELPDPVVAHGATIEGNLCSELSNPCASSYCSEDVTPKGPVAPYDQRWEAPTRPVFLPS
jgi:hypothetical protein